MATSLKDFEAVIRDFDMESLELELGRLVNSLVHLEGSNRAIEEHIQTLSLDNNENSNNKDKQDEIQVFRDAIQENIIVMRRQEEKINKIKDRMDLLDRSAHPSQLQRKPPSSDGDGSVYL